jgi:putative serine protease PepD
VQGRAIAPAGWGEIVKRLGPFIAVALVSVLATLGDVAGIHHARGASSQRTNAPTTTALNAGTQQISESTLAAAPSGAANDFAAVYAAVRPAIVEIDVSGQGGRRRPRQVQGQGSGVVLDLKGHILTNQHVVAGAQTITVTFADESTASATVVGTDPADDLAVIATNANQSELHPATLGDSGALRVGDLVAAVGNPFGLKGSLSTGVISGLDRMLSDGSGQTGQQGLLQTDAAVNEGSSGGGLFDTRGELIGITSALENPDTSTFAGVGYAVPINTAKGVLQQLLGNSTGTPSP